MLDRSRRSLAGGVSSNVRMNRQPWPLFYATGTGSQLVDVDGNAYIDYLLGQGPLLLGHSHPVVTAAIEGILNQGQLFGGQHQHEITLAERVCEGIPCADSVRFGSSGSEMVQIAIRLARAYTGRHRVLKFEGHYHGWFDNVLVSVSPPIDRAGHRARPNVVPATRGQDPGSFENTLVLPWNDSVLLEEFFHDHGDSLAAVIMEPAMFNTHAILPRSGYLEKARQLCNAYGVVLIFDEVISGFRLGLDGAQGLFNIVPDLAVFGKAMGSGFPIAALAGKNRLMDMIASGEVVHAGTYNSNLVVMAAAEATTRELVENSEPIYEGMLRRGKLLMSGITEIAQRLSVGLIVEGMPTAFAVAYTEKSKIRDFREYINHTDQSKYQHLALALLERGIHVAARGIWYLSAAHSDEDVEKTLKAVEGALREVDKKPEPAEARN